MYVKDASQLGMLPLFLLPAHLPLQSIQKIRWALWELHVAIAPVKPGNYPNLF